MRKFCLGIVMGVVSLLPATAAMAQMEGTDQKYTEERRAKRAENRRLKLYVGVGVLVIAGAVWAVKKLRGSDAPTDSSNTPSGT